MSGIYEIKNWRCQHLIVMTKIIDVSIGVSVEIICRAGSLGESSPEI